MFEDPTETDGRSAEPHLVWRQTWPFGRDDDWIVDLLPRGWARVRRILSGPHTDEWCWSIEGWEERAAGWADDCDAAMASVDARIGLH